MRDISMTTDDGIDSLGLYLADGVSADTVIEQIKALSAGRQELYISSNVSLRELSLLIFDRTFVITDILYWLTLGVYRHPVGDARAPA
jgi:putative ABC transport system permease protein